MDLPGQLGLSSFGVLAHYTIANACALTLTTVERRPPRWVPVPVPVLGGCLVLASSLPRATVLSGSAVLLLGAAIWAVPRIIRRW